MNDAAPQDHVGAYTHALMSAAVALVERADDEIRDEIDDMENVARALQERVKALREALR